MSNNREHPRIPLRCTVKIWHEEFGEALVQSKDVSDGGLFLVIEPDNYVIPPVGTVLNGQVQGLMDDAPIVQMEVVRTTDKGIGLRYLLDTK